MLRTLAIRDVVLIDRLDVAFPPGLGVLTGETGAGKSILLDALGLAIGARADSRLLRAGATQASVSAEFDLAADHPAIAILAEHGLGVEEGRLILRRVLAADGRSRAFVNDQPVGVALLRALGDTLVDIHGQFENQRLLDGGTHRALLDAYGAHRRECLACAEAFRAWTAAAAARAAAAAAREKAQREESFLRHAVEELATLAPMVGEETTLAAKRGSLMHGEKLVEALNHAAAELADGRGVVARLGAAARLLEKAAPLAGGRLDGLVAALDRATIEAADAVALVDKEREAIDLDPRRLEEVEERLFALRAAARKHGVDVDGLVDLQRRFTEELAVLEDGGTRLDALARAEAAARESYEKAAAALRRARELAAARLDKAMAAELKPLRLAAASFATRIEALPESAWGEAGNERVGFEVATNPGSPPGPLARISSGGELARFMLALKVVLARADLVPTIVFDEVDSGIGGAVAAAVGERLERLARDFQVLVITHSPQVAARGAHHWRVSKRRAARGMLTAVESLSDADRREEIARMLAGAAITDEARAAAGRLLEGRA